MGMFDWDTEPHRTKHDNTVRDCLGCYNEPCTCDNKSRKSVDNKFIRWKNPYELKRADDLNLEEVKE